MPERSVSMDQIEARLAKHRGELERAQEEYKTADAKEKAEMRSEIEELKATIKADKEAKEAKEKSEGTGGTLVLPPEQVDQGQQHGDTHGDKPASEQHEERTPEKRPKWKQAWHGYLEPY